MRDKIIAAGVRNLKEFGYPGVNSENIITDPIYSTYFKNMLNDNMGLGFDNVIKSILTDIDGAE